MPVKMHFAGRAEILLREQFEEIISRSAPEFIHEFTRSHESIAGPKIQTHLKSKFTVWKSNCPYVCRSEC
jgi:hypothetical protein